MRSVSSLFALLFVGALVSCDSDDPAPPQAVIPHVFVGHVDGSSALVAIVESDEAVVAYTCGLGDERPTHTGWFTGIKQGAVGENVQLVNGPSGYNIRAALTSEGGAGVLTLADGVELGFRVEPARGDAGLYDYEDASTVVGFIRANDGATAGSFTSLTGASSGIATGPNTPKSASVSTTSATPTTARPSSIASTARQPVVLDGTPQVVVTERIATPISRVVTRSGPVVVFLMHGMADNIGMAPPEARDNFEECSGTKNTPFYGRCEWGQDVLPGIFGTSNVRAQLTALDGSDATGDQFIRAVQDLRDLPDENLGHRMTGDCVADPEKEDVVDPRFAKHFIAPGALKPTSLPSSATQLGAVPKPPPIAAFTTWRDPTRGLVFSGRRLTRQVYAALRWYEQTYRVTPGVILLAQSFGGLASRFMLSAPDPRSLNATTNREGVTLCKEDLAKMSYVRDRTLYLLTLATPHEGSYLAEWGPPVKSTLQAVLAELRQGLSRSPLAAVIRAISTLSTVINTNMRPNLLEAAIDGIDGLLPQLDSASALLEMQLARMVEHNRTTISPERARRSASSPILGAANTLVPIYATLSRSPGSNAFDTPDVVKGLGNLQRKRAKARGWITSTMLVSDVMTRQLVPSGFGSATVAPYAQHRAILDRRARLFDASPTTTQVEALFAADIRNALRVASPWFLGRFGRTTDAILNAQRNVSVTLPTFMVPIHVSQRYRLGFDGTTIEVPIPAFECGGQRIALDLDALARLLVDTYGTTANVFTAIASRDLRAILEALSVAIQDTDTFARLTAEWFVGKVRELGNVPAACNATPANPFDVFAITELANWRIVAATGRVPIPVFIGTGEPVSDGEMDTDGAVHSASALGFTLGRVPFFFEHDRRDDGGKIGSWYRLYDNPVTEKYNHGLQYENDVGLWIHRSFLAPQVGPVPAATTFSVWPQ